MKWTYRYEAQDNGKVLLLALSRPCCLGAVHFALCFQQCLSGAASLCYAQPALLECCTK